MDTRICHCGAQFENTRVKGGSRKGGPHQIYCSPQCNAAALRCRYFGIDPKVYWKLIANGCGICGVKQDPSGRKLAVDHEHIEGFDEMPPERRRLYVRGALCITCNRFRVGVNDSRTARRLVEYLDYQYSPATF